MLSRVVKKRTAAEREAVPGGSPGTGAWSGTARVEAFSDGVMAIAITLLILTIQVPPHTRVGLLAALGRMWPAYLAYLASFFTIGIIWMNHHAFFGRLRAVDHVIRWWNLILLLCVSVLPFPTAVVADYIRDGHRDAAAATALYGLVATAMTLAWVPLWRRLARRPELFGPGFDAAFARRESLRAWAGVAVYGACVVVSLFAPVAALALYFGVAVFYAVTSQGWSPGPDTE
jgi:uncharacterized membrane protein